MGNDREIRRGDIYFVCFDPVFGHEMGGFKSRPCVVVSINDINRRTRLLTVVPGTSTIRPSGLKNIVEVLPSKDNGLPQRTHFHCHQVRAIERGRLLQLVGGLAQVDFAKIEQALAYCLGLGSS